MKKWMSAASLSTVGVLVLSAFGAAACRNGDDSNVIESFQAKLDSGLTRKERRVLLEDGLKLQSLLLSDPEGSDGSNSFAGLIFGERSVGGVLKYLDQRVNYVISFRESVEDRLVEGVSSRKLEGQVAGLQRVDDQQTVAVNLGTLSWLIAEASRPASIKFKFSDQWVDVNESRVGIVQLGKIYSNMGLFKEDLPAIYRISTLVHEARHSDCTGGIKRSEIDQLLSTGEVARQSCGHMHGVCPAGHELEGIVACDVHAWGAYAVGAVFSAWVQRSCTNCNEKDKQSAYADALDSLSRVVPIEKMLRGEAGIPDMSSSGVLPE